MDAEKCWRRGERNVFYSDGMNRPFFSPPTQKRSALRSLIILACVWFLSGAYAAGHLKRGWVPHDEGALAQSAERVFHGQLPHRDFAEIYTGGLSYFHAVAFRLLGVNLGSLRIALFFFFLAWVPAVYFIAREMLPDWMAGGVTLLAVAWSVPNYSASVPSWYNLFFATFGVAALFQYLKKPAPTWLFLAGLCGGFSFLAKSVALYYVAAVLLFFVYREQTVSGEDQGESPQPQKIYPLFLFVALASLVALLAALIRTRSGAPEIIHFVLPGAAIVLLLSFREGRLARGRSERFTALFRMIIPFLSGVIVPAAIFLIPYIRVHALHDFFHGVFVLPSRRILGASMRPEPVESLLPAIALSLLLAAAIRFRGRVKAVFTASAAAAGAYLLYGSFTHASIYLFVWHSFHEIIPVLTIAGVWRLFPSSKNPGSSRQANHQRLMLLVSVTAFCSLVQFPFAGSIYLCYVAPLAILATAGLLSTFPRPPQLFFATTAAYAFLSPVLLFTPTFLFEMDSQYTPDEQTVPLTLGRASGLRVSAESAALYEELIPFLREHAANGELLAGPDSPEVYFLSGHENPTRTLFEFFEEPAGYEERIAALLNNRPIKAAAVNLEPSFSTFYVASLQRAAAAHFPNVKRIGSFEVYWRP